MNINKTAILPVVTALFLGIGYVTGHQFSKSFIENMATYISAAIFLYVTIQGVFKNHVKQTVKVVVSETEQVAKAVETAATQVEGDVK